MIKIFFERGNFPEILTSKTPIAKFLLIENPPEGTTLKLNLDKKDNVVIVKS